MHGPCFYLFWIVFHITIGRAKAFATPLGNNIAASPQLVFGQIIDKSCMAHSFIYAIMKTIKSFTLIELIVVIAIIAILAAIIAPNAFRAIEKARSAKVISDLKTIKTASVGFYADTGQWPFRVNNVDYTFIASSLNLSGSGLDPNIHLPHPLLADPGVAGWDGPYLDKAAKTPLEYSGREVGSGGQVCPAYGHYYHQSSFFNWGLSWYTLFDLDKDETDEITNGWSINLYPVPENIRKRVNQALDGDDLAVDDRGLVKTSTACERLTYYGGTF